MNNLYVMLQNNVQYFVKLITSTQPASLIQTFILEVFSGLLVASIATWLIPIYLEWRKMKKSKMYLCMHDREKSYKLSLSSEDVGGYKGILNLDIKNSSPFSLNWVSINLYFPAGYEIELGVRTSDGDVSYTGDPTVGYVVSCMMKRPIHPHRYHHFPCRIFLKINERNWNEKNSFCYYYFSTEYGLFPKSAEFVNEEDRQVKLSDMEKFLKIEIKKPS